MTSPVRLFVSYSHLDAAWFQRMRILLKFRDVQLAHVWHDQELTAGGQWDREIREELESMDVFVCLVSHNFYCSDYIMNVELPRAQERHAAGEVVVVPVLLEEFNLKRELPFLHGLMHLPAFERAWTTFNPRSNAHRLIRDGIHDAIQRSEDQKLKTR